MFALTVENTLRIKKRGVVVTGRVASGSVRVGDTVFVGETPLVVEAIDVGRRSIDQAAIGDSIGLRFDASADCLADGVQLTAAPPRG